LMLMCAQMNQSENLPFRGYAAQMIANLEDADAGVRDTAKHAVVDLFTSAPEHAKANLKKQLVATNVRKAIATFITAHLDGAATAATHEEMPPPPPAARERPLPTQRAQALQPDHGFADSLAAEQPPPTETVTMDPIHIYTQRELEDVFRDMAPPFEGRESEQNWLARDKNTTKLRRILMGNAPSEFPESGQYLANDHVDKWMSIGTGAREDTWSCHRSLGRDPPTELHQNVRSDQEHCRAKRKHHG
jgi:CLIP-associating protein 1/2